MNTDRWNGEHFPYKLILKEKTLTLNKYLLDNLEGDINLEEAPIQELLKINGKDEIECLNLFHKLFDNIL